MRGETNITSVSMGGVKNEIDSLKSQTVKRKLISSGATIQANSYLSLTDASLANKTFQGVQINGIAAYNVYYTSAFISGDGFTLSLINKGSSAATTGAINVYYKD